MKKEKRSMINNETKHKIKIIQFTVMVNKIMLKNQNNKTLVQLLMNITI
jgi:hypothetical protein